MILPAVFRSSLPEDQRLNAEQVVADLRPQGVDARYLPIVDDIVRTVARESTSGDIVVIMSNGGFGGIHQRLLRALGDRDAGARGRAHAAT